LVVALAFSNLVKAFTDDIINPLVAAARGQVKGPEFDRQLVPVGADSTYRDSAHSSPRSSTSSSTWRASIS